MLSAIGPNFAVEIPGKTLWRTMRAACALPEYASGMHYVTCFILLIVQKWSILVLGLLPVNVGSTCFDYSARIATCRPCKLHPTLTAGAQLLRAERV